MGRRGRGGCARLHDLGRGERSVDAMSRLDHNILTVITLLPAAGAAILMAFPRGEKSDRAVKWFSLEISIAAFIPSLHLPYYFDKTSPAFQFSIDKVWMASPNIHYHI